MRTFDDSCITFTVYGGQDGGWEKVPSNSRECVTDKERMQKIKD